MLVRWAEECLEREMGMTVFLQCALQEIEELSLDAATEEYLFAKWNLKSNLIIHSIAPLGINTVVVQACSTIQWLVYLGFAGRITVGGSYSVSHNFCCLVLLWCRSVGLMETRMGRSHFAPVVAVTFLLSAAEE